MDEPTLEELQQAARPSFRMSSAGRRRPEQRGGGEALETIGGALLGSVPAGLAGLASLPFQGPAGAAQTVERVQDIFTPVPTTEGGIQALRGLAGPLSAVGAPAQAVGDVTLRATGSPLAATAAEVVLDPLNALGLVAGAKPLARAAARGAQAVGRGARRAGAATVESLGPKIAELTESYLQRTGQMPSIFVGKSSRTWDAASNARAAEMESAGAAPQDIWRETGNWRAPDGQWRQEISDLGFTLPRVAQPITEADRVQYQKSIRRNQQIDEEIKRILQNKSPNHSKIQKLKEESYKNSDFQNDFRSRARGQSSASLGRLAPHEELFAAYPQFQNLRITDYPMSDQGLALPGKFEMLINPSAANRENIAIHELQHFIQDLEKFSPGGEQKEYLKDTASRLQRIYQERKEVGRPALDRGYYTAEEKARLNDLMDQEAALSPFGQYQRLKGEAESRAAEARMNLTPEERRATFPEESYDVPIGELIDAPRTGGPALLTTYHGTPHTFPAEPGLPLGRFRAEKIGSGEGAQAYGHGIYVAESPDVAKSYKLNLEPKNIFEYGGKSGLTADQVKKQVSLTEGSRYLDNSSPASSIADIVMSGLKYGNTKMPAFFAPNSERAKMFEKLSQEIAKKNTGALYTVDLPDSIVDRMLDWDSPVNEATIQALKKIKIPNKSLKSLNATDVDDLVFMYSEKTGGEWYDILSDMLGGDAKASAALRKAGVPGVKYFDQMSRNEGQGTRNFVVFPGEEQNLRILERDGVKVDNPVKKADGGAVKGSDMSYAQVADTIAGKLTRQGMDSGEALTNALRMAQAHMAAGGAVLMSNGGDIDNAIDQPAMQGINQEQYFRERDERQARELAEEKRLSMENELAAMRAVAPSRQWMPSSEPRRSRYQGPQPNRPTDARGRPVVSAEELADFQRQFGADKTLRDLLNADRGLTRRETPSAQDMRARGPQGASEAPASPYSDPSRVMEGVAASQREIARPGRDAVQSVAPELALLLAPRIAQLLGVSVSGLRARLTAAGKDWRTTPPRGADRAKWDAIVKQIDDAAGPSGSPSKGPSFVQRPEGGRIEPPFGAPQPNVRGVMERAEPMLAGGGVLKAATRAGARAAERAAVKAAEAAPKAPEAVTLTGAHRPAVEPVRGQTSRELQAQQQRMLTAEQQDKLAALKRQYPEFGHSSQFMTPQELAKVIDRPDSVRAMNRLLEVLPSSQNLAAVAKAGEPKRGWYRASTQAIIDVFGLEDAPRFSALLAAMSPQTSVEMNLLNTLNTWKNWTAAGRPTDPGQIRKIMGASVAGTKGEQSVLEAWANNATRALTAPDPREITLSGPKVDSFYRNLADDVYRVTNDAWMASGLGVSQNLFSGAPTALQLRRGDPGLTPGYMGTSARMREAGQQAGILPSEAQETTWSFFMPLYEMQAKTGLPARDILQRGLLTPESIRGTPDFSTLLQTGRYGDILRQAGYGEQLEALKPAQFGSSKVDLTLPEQREVEAAAKRLEGLKEMRGTESRSRSISLPPKRERPQTAFAVEPHEYIPGAGVRLGESMVTAPMGSREQYSSAISSLFRDPMGRDRLQKAVGLNPLPTRSGTGAFRPSGEVPYQGMVGEDARGQRMPVESQPAFASVAEVPVVGGGLDIAKKAKERLGAAAATRGYLTGQHGSTYNVQIPRRSGESMLIKREGKADPDAMRYAYSLLDDAGYLADTGAGVNVLYNPYKPGNVPFTDKERVDLEQILGGQGIVPSRNVSEYIDYSPAWMGPEGSGAATKQLLGRVAPLSQPEQKALSRETQDIAGGLYDLYTSKSARTGDEYRADLMRALQILRDKGLPGLAAALAAGEALPSEGEAGRGSR